MSRYTTFKHWIFSKNKKPLYLDGNGNILEGDINTLLKPDGTMACLQHSPTGWRDTLIKYGRNVKYLGIFRDFTVPMRFVLDAAKIIKDSLWNVGFEAVLFYGLSKYNRYAFPPAYEVYYTGELDLSKAKQDRNGINVSALEGGPAKWLKAFESTVYEIPVYADEQAVNVYMDGFPFKNKIEWTIYENQAFDGSSTYQLGMGIISSEGSSQGIIVQDEQYKNALAVQPNEDGFFRSVTKSITANISGSIQVDMGTSMDLQLNIRKVKIVNGVAVTVTNYDISTGVLAVGVHTIDYSETIPVGEGEQLYLTVKGDAASPGVDFNILNGNMLLDYEVRFDPTFCKGLKPKRLFELLWAKMCDNKYGCASSLLDAMDKLVYTSGMAIRNFTDEKSVIKISFADFYKSLQRFGIMLGVENNQLVIEHYSHAFQSTIIANLGTVADFTIDVAEDMIYNTIKAGYQNKTYDKVNGLDEFNVSQQWTTAVLKVPKELDLMGPVRADMYGIEITRLDLNGKDTTDSSADNDTFFLSVELGADIIYWSRTYEVTGSDTIRIPSVLAMLPNGTSINVAGLGTFIIANTSYLMVGYTLITVTTAITNGSYSGIIDYSDANVYKLYRPAYSAISGLLHPDEAFNVELNPKEALINNAAFIHSFLEDQAGLVKFQSADKNSLMSKTLDGVTITQNEDIQVSDLTAPLYYPYYFEFETQVPVNFISLMKANPYGTIQFSDEKGNIFYGFMWDGSVKPATDDKQKFKLLCSPQTNKQHLL